MVTPILHKSIPIGTVVIISEGLSKELTGLSGEVAGVSSTGPVFNYIVLLDESIYDPDFGSVKAVSIPGTHLEDFYHRSFKIDEYKHIYLIDDTEKVIVPKDLGPNQKIVMSNFLVKNLIISERVDGDYGSSFVKIGKKTDKVYTWISSSLNSEDLTGFIREHFKISPKDLTRFW
jgi:hypothetical protein